MEENRRPQAVDQLLTQDFCIIWGLYWMGGHRGSGAFENQSIISAAGKAKIHIQDLPGRETVWNIAASQLKSPARGK